MSILVNHGAASILDGLGCFEQKPSPEQESGRKQKLLDETRDAAGIHAAAEIRAAAVVAAMEWAKTVAEDLGQGETSAQRLIAMLIGIADENKDGELSEDEADVVDIAAQAAAEFLISKGVSEADAVALIEGEDDEVATRVQELLSEVLPDDEAEQFAAVDAFVFDSESSESVLDGVLDAVYKKAVVVRQGKKVRINKRISGSVRLSAAQKVAIRKAGLKSRSAAAKVQRLKSMKVRKRLNLK